MLASRNRHFVIGILESLVFRAYFIEIEQEKSHV